MKKSLILITMMGAMAFAGPNNQGPEAYGKCKANGECSCPFQNEGPQGGKGFKDGSGPGKFERGMPDPARMEAHMEKVFEKLNLNEDQKTKLRAFHKERFANKQDLHTEMRAARQEFRQLTSEYPPNEKALRDQQAKINELEAQLEEDRLAGMLYLSKVLSKEQYQEFHQLMRQKGQKRGKKNFN